jgi:uncharacterized protein (TIGR03067 family)
MRLLTLLLAGLFAGTLPAADDKKDKPKDEETIVGVWKVEKLDDGSGKELPAEEVGKMRLIFSKEGKLVSRQSFGGESKGEYKLDTSAKPKAIDITESQQPTFGIYELDGDSLKICVGQNKTRPTDLKPDNKAGHVLLTLKRVKDEKKDK